MAVGQPSAVSKAVVVITNMTESIRQHELERSTQSNSIEWRGEEFYKYFSVESVVGRGRFSLVKQAFCRMTGRSYAVKCFSRHQDAQRIDKSDVEREIQTLNHLRHSSIVQAFGAFQTTHEYIVVLQWIPGPSVFEFVCHLGHYTEEMMLEFAKDLLEGLNYLHDFNFAHLDIKPENLLIDPSNSTARLIIVDLGSARQCDGNPQTLFWQGGSAEFAAPEQVAGLMASTASDIWAFGVFLYTFVSGTSAFLDESFDASCSNIVKGDFYFPKKLFHGVCGLLKDLIAQCLKINTCERFTTKQCLESYWINASPSTEELSTIKLEEYLERRKYEISKCDDIIPL
uniref:Protein kinase domain-containing protein n=1 Tax=Plectus sambesii TaxID=2011161 RepID=A0A914UIU5_9BILA